MDPPDSATPEPYPTLDVYPGLPLPSTKFWAHARAWGHRLLGQLVCAYFLATMSGLAWMPPCYLLLLALLPPMERTVLFGVLCIYMGYVLGPGRRTPVAWPPLLRRWSGWKWMRRYFDYRLRKTADLDPSGNYLFCCHPHGIMAFSTFMAFTTDPDDIAEKYPGIDVCIATLESNFSVPLLREHLLLHGGVGASRHTIRKILSGGPGRSVALVVGGASEALLTSPDTMDLVLNCRRGFVRLALQTGASLVPVLGMQENSLFHTHIPQPGSRSFRVLRRIKAVLGFSTPLFWGTSFFGGPGLIPLQRPLTTVVGAPVPMPRLEHPTREDVDKGHAQYVAALRQLWDEHKDELAPNSRRSLEVVQ